MSRVRVTEGKITVKVGRKSRGNRFWFELARGSSTESSSSRESTGIPGRREQWDEVASHAGAFRALGLWDQATFLPYIVLQNSASFFYRRVFLVFVAEGYF